MFWSQREQLTDELRLRLRAAADFATLGAYELSGDEDVSSEHIVRDEPPQRVFMFAKVAPVCPHSAAAERPCGEPSSHGARARRRSIRRQRGGAVHVPEQPCICPLEPLPGA
jgi:hypothetical protein